MVMSSSIVKNSDIMDAISPITRQEQRVRERMSSIRYKIAVLSGKGGVGKSTITANLALSFKGWGIGVVDADINGRSIPKLFGVREKAAEITSVGVLPVIGHEGIKIISMDFLIKDNSPVLGSGSSDSEFVWFGGMERSAMMEFLSDVLWGELDLLLFDLSPGVDQIYNIKGLLPELDGVIVVTTPSDLSIIVVERTMTLLGNLNIPIIGLIENMCGLICPDCGGYINHSHAGENLAEKCRIPYLGKIPYLSEIAQSADKGMPYVINNKDSHWTATFSYIGERIKRELMQREN